MELEDRPALPVRGRRDNPHYDAKDRNSRTVYVESLREELRGFLCPRPGNQDDGTVMLVWEGGVARIVHGLLIGFIECVVVALLLLEAKCLS